MWTGNSVVDMIERGDMEWINKQLGRKAFIWLNYPVNDYCQSRMLMGKTYGNGLDINEMVSGFCSNPMEYAEASKVSLYSIADYTWNMPQYDAVRSWQQAITELMPTASEPFRWFCENNIDWVRRATDCAARARVYASPRQARPLGRNTKASSRSWPTRQPSCWPTV